jgi:dephospho-CoA kinase
MVQRKTANLFEEKPQEEESLQLADRQTDELVIAFVGPVGSGVSKSVEILYKKLSKTFDYDVDIISVSKDIIAKSANIVGEECDPNSMGSERVSVLQKIGSKLRSSFSNDYLAEKCVEKIAIDHAHKGYREISGNRIPLPRRKAYIIDSLKHPGEYELLRDVYGDSLWLFGIFAPEDVRRDRLISKGFNGEQIQSIFNIDEEEGVKHGQKVRDTIEMSDFFIRNDGPNNIRLDSSRIPSFSGSAFTWLMSQYCSTETAM